MFDLKNIRSGQNVIKKAQPKKKSKSTSLYVKIMEQDILINSFGYLF